MSNNGWIKLHRQIVDNWIWQDPEKLKAWLDILLMVNHEDKKILINGRLVMIKRGEKLTSIVKLSERWGWSRNRVKTFLALLESDGMCTTNRSTLGTTLKVSNYAVYQDYQPSKNTTVEPTDRPPNEPPNRPADEPADRPQTITNKNNKNEEVFFGADAQKKIPPEFDDVKAYVRSKGYKMEVTEFMTYYEMRGWTLTNGRKITDWRAAVDYWASKSRKDSKADTPPMPYFREVSETAPVIGTEAPYEGGVVAELIRRKRAKNA